MGKKNDCGFTMESLNNWQLILRRAFKAWARYWHGNPNLHCRTGGNHVMSLSDKAGYTAQAKTPILAKRTSYRVPTCLCAINPAYQSAPPSFLSSRQFYWSYPGKKETYVVRCSQAVPNGSAHATSMGRSKSSAGRPRT